MTRGDLVFVDTNVLLSVSDMSRADHTACTRLFSAATEAGIHLAVTGQIVREYLVVATRPVPDNGLGLSPANALRNSRELRSRCHLVPEPREVVAELESLVGANSLRGKRIHDANLVAAMRTHGIGTLLTANVDDFRPYEAVTALTPADAIVLLEGLAS